MRKRKYLIGSLGLALAVSFAAIAQAAVTSQEVSWAPNPSPTKQDKKKKGGVAFGVFVKANYTTFAPVSSHVEQATIHFDKDIAVTPGTLPQCAKSSIQTATTEAAKAACPGSVLGTGEAHLNGALGPASGVVTAFNGIPSAGAPVIELHARIGPPLNATQVLTGTIQPSSKAGQGYGKQLFVPVAPIAGGAQVIADFSTALSKIVSVKGKKKKGKKIPPKFYLSANCSDKIWNIEGDFKFVDNPPPVDPTATVENVTLTGKDTAPCKQKPKKKKKK